MNINVIIQLNVHIRDRVSCYASYLIVQLSEGLGQRVAGLGVIRFVLRVTLLAVEAFQANAALELLDAQMDLLVTCQADGATKAFAACVTRVGFLRAVNVHVGE